MLVLMMMRRRRKMMMGIEDYGVDDDDGDCYRKECIFLNL